MTPHTTGKILGIGLSRTGTKSLKAALIHLGYRAAHFTEHQQVQRGLGSWFEGDFTQDELQEFDVALDYPIPSFFRELDQRYPGSRFILTTRERSRWLESMQRLIRHVQSFDELLHPYRRAVREKMFGTLDFDAEKFLDTYDRHHQDVLEYFRDRPADLLILDISQQQGWLELCHFLGDDVPEVEFPWVLDSKPSFAGENG